MRMGRGIQIYTRCSIIRGVLVQVHARDRYERFRSVFACMGPGDGPIRPILQLDAILTGAKTVPKTQEQSRRPGEGRRRRC